MGTPSQRSQRPVSSGLKGSLFVKARIREAANRGVLAVIAAGAIKRRKVLIRYTKVTTGETVDRIIEPYSFRYKRSSLGKGRWKILFGWHGTKRTIKQFLVANIHAAKMTRYEFVPRFEVEIS